MRSEKQPICVKEATRSFLPTKSFFPQHRLLNRFCCFILFIFILHAVLNRTIITKRQNQVRQQHDQQPYGRQSEGASPQLQLQPRPQLQLRHQQRHPITVPIVLRSQTLKTFTTNIIVNRYCLRPPTTTMHSLISPRNRQRHPQPPEPLPPPPPKSPPEQSVPSTMV